MTAASGRRPPPRARAVLAGVLAALGALLLGLALDPAPTATGDSPPLATDGSPSGADAATAAPSGTSSATAQPSGPAGSAGRSSSRSSRVRDRTTGLVLPASDPVSVSVPRIGVRSRLVELGLGADGAMEVPRDPSLAGWFTGSAAPGALGPAVVAGHVTWDRAPAVFSHLGSLRRGDEVDVAREDGRTAVFTVDRVARFSKSRFPSRAVYGTIDHAGLRLITCGGTYDTAAHRYLDNVVVFASLTTVRGPRG